MGTKPVREHSTSSPNCLPVAASPNAITLGTEFQHMNLGETHTVYIWAVLVLVTEFCIE